MLVRLISYLVACLHLLEHQETSLDSPEREEICLVRPDHDLAAVDPLLDLFRICEYLSSLAGQVLVRVKVLRDIDEY